MAEGRVDRTILSPTVGGALGTLVESREGITEGKVTGFVIGITLGTPIGLPVAILIGPKEGSELRPGAGLPEGRDDGTVLGPTVVSKRGTLVGSREGIMKG